MYVCVYVGDREARTGKSLYVCGSSVSVCVCFLMYELQSVCERERVFVRECVCENAYTHIYAYICAYNPTLQVSMHIHIPCIRAHSHIHIYVHLPCHTSGALLYDINTCMYVGIQVCLYA